MSENNARAFDILVHFFAIPCKRNNSEERKFWVSDVTCIGYLLELIEHANLMAAVQLGKILPKKTVFPWLDWNVVWTGYYM